MTVDDGKWPLVRQISVELRTGVVEKALHALEHASNARRIEISSSELMFYSEASEEAGFDQQGLLDRASLSGRISCASLTHLRLGQRSLRYAESVGTLCNLAHNLTHFDINLDYVMGDPLFPDDDPLVFPPPTGPTKIIGSASSIPEPSSGRG